jgi:methionyl-tRNA formyltransferase
MAKIYKTSEIKKVVFLGTPEFAVNSLEKLVASKYRPCLVVTQPDKPKGRKQKLQPTPVKISSEKYGLPVIQPLNINSDDALKEISAVCPDIIITVAYGGFLGKKIRNLAPLGCINLHPSLLPKYRGASPLQSTLFHNETKSGVTIFKIVAKMDAGPIINQIDFDVPAKMNFSEYSEYSAEIGADLLIKTLEEIEQQGFELQKQDSELATETVKIEKEFLLIDWSDNWENILGKIRGLSDQPGARTLRDGKSLQILRAENYAKTTTAESGTITQILKNKGFVVSCGGGEVLITEVKPEGKKAMSAHAYNLGAKLSLYEKLG